MGSGDGKCLCAKPEGGAKGLIGVFNTSSRFSETSEGLRLVVDRGGVVGVIAVPALMDGVIRPTNGVVGVLGVSGVICIRSNSCIFCM